MKNKKLHFFIIDDDKDMLQVVQSLLEGVGHFVTATTSSNTALEKIIELQPDCVISDLNLPSVSGFELFGNLRKLKNIKQPVFIILTSRQYGFDANYADKIGVDGYLRKPIHAETFVKEVLGYISDEMIVQFWGVRGTLPLPGKLTTQYGGNTNCISLCIGKKKMLIFDGGSGIKSLSSYLIKQKKSPISAAIFITHPHWDHINGLPFFAPFYAKNNEFQIFGSNHAEINLDNIISSQMDSVFFPVTIREFSAYITYHPLNEETIWLNDIRVQTMHLVHPGRCLGYRIDYKDKSFCYITDNELYLETSPNYNKFDFEKLLRFVSNTNMLITDTTYSDDEYVNKENWGHSCVGRVVDLAHQANVKLLCLHHHDPDQMDKDINSKLKKAKAKLKKLNSLTQCVAPHEGDSIVLE